MDGNSSLPMGDFAGSAFNRVVAIGGPPQPTTRWEILSEEADGDAVRFHIRYANDTDALELETRWEQFDGVWKVVQAQKVGV